MPLSVLTLLSLTINVPLGYLRSGCRRLSWPWFACLHLSIPLIAVCRISSGIGFAAVPILIVAGIAGQLLGARIRS